MSCDAAIVTLLEGGNGAALSIGRRRRTIPPAIRRALQARDAGCRFRGCTHTHFLHAHHIRHWAAGCHTALTNLVTLCSYHHKLVHEGGFSLQRDAEDEGLVFRTPSGCCIAPAPPAPGGSAGSLATDNARRGIDVSAETGASQWDGAHVDYEHVLFTSLAVA